MCQGLFLHKVSHKEDPRAYLVAQPQFSLEDKRMDSLLRENAELTFHHCHQEGVHLHPNQSLWFKFLNFSNYLAGGVFYSTFLKACKIEELKAYFPCEWLDNVSKLDYPCLPLYGVFYSKLKKNLQTLGDMGKGEENNDDEDHMSDDKASGVEQFQELQDIW